MSCKIVHVQVIPQVSGVQRVSLDILSNLPEGYNRYIIFGGSYDAQEQLLKECRDNNITVIFSKHLKREIGLCDIKATIELINIFKKYQFDIIHTNSTKPGIVARLAAKIAGCKKIVHSVHGIAFHKSEKLSKKVIYYTIEFFFSFLSNQLISVNEYYLKYYPQVKKKIAIHNSIVSGKNDAHYCVKERANKFILGFMARLDKQKDPMTLCRAIQFGVEQHFFDESSLGVTIAGDGELRRECELFIAENNLQKIVQFRGWVSDKHSFYQTIDALCLPSIYEAFGLVLLEAAAYSKPSIATNVEGIPEVIMHGVNGLLFDPKDYKTLAEEIKRYILTPQLIKEHGVNARSIMYRNFNFDVMINRYIQVYDSL